MKDDIVYALYKDEILGSKHAFEKQIKKFINEINVSEVYLRILNYQIDKYGCVLSKYNEPFSSYSNYKKADRARQRKYDHSNRRFAK